jgi:hypothetical protein
MPPSAAYPITLEAASDLCEQLRLSPFETFIEPSRFAGLCSKIVSATAFGREASQRIGSSD